MLDLLERDSALAELDRLLDRVGNLDGAAVLITGPAGIGKSALLGELLERSRFRGWVGRCDDLAIPQALGPFEDIARQVERLSEPFAAGPTAFRRALVDSLERSPTILAIEDLHWADQATLDLVQFLGRRISLLPLLLVATVRPGLGLDHSATTTLGKFPPGTLHRIDLDELSPDAVAHLCAETDRDPEEVYRLTDGNPFLVTELLNTDSDVPPTVAESVAARLGGLGEGATRIAGTAAVIPGEAEWELVETLFPGERTAVADLEVAGVFASSVNGVGFRHELLRQAVEESLSPSQRRKNHEVVLTALLGRSAAPSRLAHHAAGCGDRDTLAQASMAAMEHASSAGAHTEALRHGLNVLAHIDLLPARDQARVWETVALEHWFNQNDSDAIEANREAIRLWDDLGDRVRLGDSLRRAAGLEWPVADHDHIVGLTERAIAVLESVGPCPELVEAYVSRAQDFGYTSRIAEALEVLDQAVAMGEAIDDGEKALARAYAAREVQLMAWGHPHQARSDGDLAMELFAEVHDQRGLTTTCGNRVAGAINTLQLDHLDEDLETALRYADEIDSTNFDSFLTVQTARIDLHRGRWDRAGKASASVLERVPGGPHRTTALIVAALLEARTGGGRAGEFIDEALSLVSPTRDIQRVGSVAATVAEMIWLGHDLDIGYVEDAHRLATESGFVRYRSGLAIWLRRLGREVDAPDPAPEPHRRELSGDATGAAEAWAELGFPCQQALTLAFSGEPDSMRRSIDIVESLDASASRDRIRRMMRDRGIALGRRPTRSTRSNAAGLTRRQMEVLVLLADDLSNAEIADRLFISPKTVDHHVSAILTRLGVADRHQAAARLPELQVDA